MSRIEKKFQSLNRPALVTFTMAGDPDLETSLEILKSLPEAGADLIELGMPFTDPVADGPVIQQAGQRALKAGANMKQTLSMVREFRKNDTETPIILMGYVNPVHAYGEEAFLKDASEAGVDGIIIVDLPPEEDKEFRKSASAHGIDVIRLITPTTKPGRIKPLVEGASGFLYYVSITGVTGAKKASPQDLVPHLGEIRKYTNLPIAIGFGIKTPEDAAQMGEIANAVVVGSAIIKTLQDNPDNAINAANDYIRSLAKALA